MYWLKLESHRTFHVPNLNFQNHPSSSIWTQGKEQVRRKSYLYEKTMTRSLTTSRQKFVKKIIPDNKYPLKTHTFVSRDPPVPYPGAPHPFYLFRSHASNFISSLIKKEKIKNLCIADATQCYTSLVTDRTKPGNERGVGKKNQWGGATGRQASNNAAAPPREGLGKEKKGAYRRLNSFTLTSDGEWFFFLLLWGSRREASYSMIWTCAIEQERYQPSLWCYCIDFL